MDSYNNYNEAGQPLGYCMTCHRVRWLAVVGHCDAFATPETPCGTCTQCERERVFALMERPDVIAISGGQPVYRQAEGDDSIAQTADIQDFSATKE
jgi:hypothetical protein